MIFRGFAILALLAGLTACALNPSVTPTAEVVDVSERSDDLWNFRKLQLEQITSWSLKGRLGVKAKKRGGSATVIWSRDGEEHHIELYGPFGGGRVIIAQTADGAILRDNKKNEFYGETAEELLYSRLGWHVPFQAMQYWVSGLPAPGDAELQQVDTGGLLTQVSQQGWMVTFNEYAAQDELLLPRKLVVSALPGTVQVFDRKGRDLGDELDVKLVIKRFTL